MNRARKFLRCDGATWKAIALAMLLCLPRTGQAQQQSAAAGFG